MTGDWNIFKNFVNTKHRIFALSSKIKQQYLKYNKNLSFLNKKIV